MTVDFSQARFNMIEQQIRPWDVLDPAVLAVFDQIPRHVFVDARQQHLAYADLDIPLDHGQRMLAPKIEGKLLQALDIQPQENVLIVGTGSGFLTALTSRLSATVTSIEKHQSLSAHAGQKYQSLNIQNVELVVGDIAEDVMDGTFDVIMVTAALTPAMSFITQKLQTLLGDNGRMITFEKTFADASLCSAVLTRHMAGAFITESLFETQLDNLEVNGLTEAFDF